MTKESVSTLKARSVRFRSEHDEHAFFEWINKLSCIKSVRGEGAILNITLDRRKVNDPALRELLALFARFGIDMTQLARFETPSNRSWFLRPGSYWFRKVFRQEARSPSTRGNRTRSEGPARENRRNRSRT